MSCMIYFVEEILIARRSAAHKLPLPYALCITVYKMTYSAKPLACDSKVNNLRPNAFCISTSLNKIF